MCHFFRSEDSLVKLLPKIGGGEFVSLAVIVRRISFSGICRGIVMVLCTVGPH